MRAIVSGFSPKVSEGGLANTASYQFLFDYNPLPMWVFDTVTFRFLMVNAAALKIYGYSKAEFLHMSLKDIRPVEEVETFVRLVESKRELLSHAGIWTHIKKDGTLLHVEVMSHALPLDGGNQKRLVVIHDMTSRVKAEEQLKEAQKLVTSTLQNIVEVVFSMNAEQEIIYISPQCLAISGYRPEAFYQDKKLWFSLVNPDDRDLFQRAMSEVITSGEPLLVEYRIKDRDGNEKWLVSRGGVTLGPDGNMTRIDGSVHDITEQKYTEERLQFSDFSIAKSSESFFWTNHEGKIIRVNQAATNLLGFSALEFVQLNIAQLDYSLDQDAWQELWQECKTGHSISRIAKFKAKNGAYYPVEVFYNYFTFNNKCYSFISVREISERMHAEADKAKLTEETIRQNEHLRQFAYIVSHNLRAPVANILGLVNMYNKNDSADPLNLQLVQKLEITSRRLDATIKDINEILTIRTNTTQNLEPLALGEVCLEVLEGLAPELEQNQVCVYRDFTCPEYILGIKGYVHSIFFNLISNAIKYRHPERNLEIHIKALFSDGQLVVTLKDNGLGINLDKQRHKVFGLYRRFHPHIEGKGIGLHISKTQMESMGGKIEIESTEGKGTMFKLFFHVPQKEK